MVRDAELLRKFEDEELKKERLTHAEALRLLDAMWREARNLGALPLKDPLEGIESDIRLAGILNSCSKSL